MLRIIGDGEHARVIRDAAGWRAWFTWGGILGIGDVDARYRAYRESWWWRQWRTVIHRKATVSRSAHVNEGVYVGPRAVINAGAYVACHAIINSGSVVEHDVYIGPFVNVGPGVVIGGGAKVMFGTTLGLGCKIRDHVRVGEAVTVGMGAVVVSDIPDGVTVMGCPARIVKRA